MSEYLFNNKETSLTKIIFATRSGTLDITEWNPWKYDDLSCVGCGTETETMHHFMTCIAYGKDTEYTHWKDIYKCDLELQSDIGRRVRRRLEMRSNILEADDSGLDSTPGSHAPLNC